MTQTELDRELARSTGESLSTIRGRGFSLIVMPDRNPLVVDWDHVQQREPSPVLRSPLEALLARADGPALDYVTDCLLDHRPLDPDGAPTPSEANDEVDAMVEG